MLSDDNGCLCHHLPVEAQPCIACRGRMKSEEHCKKCKKGLFPQEIERDGLCSNCHYDQ